MCPSPVKATTWPTVLAESGAAARRVRRMRIFRLRMGYLPGRVTVER
jgi:hypothetical protein